jgi:DNA polymerase-3 subunit alpha
MDKKNNKMAFVKIEDFENNYEAVVFGSVFPKVEDKLNTDAVLLLRGRLNSELDDPVIKVICEEAYYLEDAPVDLTDSIILRIDKSKLSEKNITYLKNILYSHPGKSPLFFRVAVNGKDEINLVSKKIKVSVNASLLNDLEKILKLENIKIKVKN